MANHVQYKDTTITIGDTIAVDYKIREADGKTRIQQFAGILIKIKGVDENTRMITVRKISKSGVGVERIFPLSSPFIDTIKVTKKSLYPKARAFFIRDLSQKNTRLKLYKSKVEAADIEEAPEQEAASA